MLQSSTGRDQKPATKFPKEAQPKLKQHRFRNNAQESRPSDKPVPTGAGPQTNQELQQ